MRDEEPLACSAERTVVAGVGNDLAGDDGLGAHVARALAAAGLRPGVEVVDAGLSADVLLASMQGCQRLVLVDAMRAGGPPGTVYRTEVNDAIDDLLVPGGALSLHQAGLGEVLRQARAMGLLPPRITLIGAEPADVEPSLALSPPLEAAAAKITEALASELSETRTGRALS